MAQPRRSKRRTAGGSLGWQQFAAMSRRALGSAGRRAAKPSRRRAGARAAAPPSAPTLKQATTQALELGRKQAAWVIAQRTRQLAARAGVVAAAEAKRATKDRGRPSLPEAPHPARSALARRAGPSRGLLVAEGDSWFDYPFHDVLKRLYADFGWEIEQVSHRGDTVESMAYDGGQLDDFVWAIERVVGRGQSPHAILVSGGGNDVAGDWFGMLLDHRSSPTFGLNSGVVEAVLDTRVRVAYTTILSAVTATCETLLGAPVPILLHGYDYPVPDGRGFLGGLGWLPGPWLEPGFREKGYDDLVERVAIAHDLIDRFYAMLAEVVATPAFAHVQLVDLRNALSDDVTNGRYKDWWGNELHPTRDGFTKVAGLFDAELSKL
jgi:hypothetical protein